MYNLRRLSRKPQKIISDRKEMKPFWMKLSVSPRTGARGARPEGRVILFLSLWPELRGKEPLLAFKTHVRDNIIGSFLPPRSPRRESPSISKCHVKCFSRPALTQKTRCPVNTKETPLWMAAIAPGERQLSSPFVFALSLICPICHK